MNDYQPKMDIEQVVGAGEEKSGPASLPKKWIIGGLLFAGLIAAIVFGASRSGSEPSYVTVNVERGDLDITVTATGTTQPSNEVIVGTEVSGTIETVLVDFNEKVRAGQVLARLDTTILAAQAAQAKAALESAIASRGETEASYSQAKRDLDRLLDLQRRSGGALPAQLDIDTAQAALERAEASRKSAAALVNQSRAQLAVARTELTKATIVSPINGVVLSRKVDPGQTVAATLQTPELFVLAQNLTEMELSIAIDEADVGMVEVGQSASFTVDAYPNEQFAAQISQVQFAAQVEGGVVTYEAILSVDNSDLRLRPGMTVTAIITTEQVEDALLVPNTALRFVPELTDADDDRGFVSSLLPRAPGSDVALPDAATNGNRRTIWVLSEEGELRPVRITIGASNGSFTVVTSGDLEPGIKVVTEKAAS